MQTIFSTIGKIFCVLVSCACIAFLVYMNINDRLLEQQAAAQVAAVNEDTRETEKEIAQVEEQEKAAALEEKMANDSFYQKLADGFDVRILVLGDTIANGYGASSAEATWPNLLKESLKSQYNIDVTLDNASLIDSNTYASYARVKMMEEEDYDLAIICTGASDDTETLAVYYEALLRAIRSKFTKCSVISIQEYMDAENNARNLSIMSLANAYNALSVDMHNKMLEDPASYIQEGNVLNDAGNQLYADSLMSTITGAVDAGTEYVETQETPIYTETAKYDDFLYVPADAFTRTGRQYAIENSFRGVIAYHFDAMPGDNSFDVYVDRVKTATQVVNNRFASPVEHIELIGGEVNVSRRVGIIFATEEAAESFQGMCVTVTE